jgi:hypothetical protein
MREAANREGVTLEGKMWERLKELAEAYGVAPLSA